MRLDELDWKGDGTGVRAAMIGQHRIVDWSTSKTGFDIIENWGVREPPAGSRMWKYLDELTAQAIVYHLLKDETDEAG
jgi:hypothetical protein